MSATDQPPIGNQSEPDGQVGAILNLAYVVRNVQNELNDYSMQSYKRLLQLAIDGLGFLNIYHNPCVQVAYLQCNDAGIVPFPKDYVTYNKIAIYCHGQLINLSINNNMALNRAQVCGEDIRVMESEQGLGFINGLQSGYQYAPFYYGGAWQGSLYGLGGGFAPASYRIDETARQIQFVGFIPNDRRVVLEYQSTGISAGTLIGRPVMEVLKKYVHLYRIKYDPRESANTKAMLENDFNIAVGQLRAFNGKFTMSEYKDILFRNHKQSPKV